MHPERKITRLRDYDYRQNGGYFVTICTHNRRCVFGCIEEGEMRLNRFGRIVRDQWLATGDKRPYLHLDEWVVMPNHFHAIVFILGGPAHEPETVELRRFGQPQARSLGTIIGRFKGAVKREIGVLRGCETEVWQGRFQEHILRDDFDLQTHRQYIRNNPAKWHLDEFHVGT